MALIGLMFLIVATAYIGLGYDVDSTIGLTMGITACLLTLVEVWGRIIGRAEMLYDQRNADLVPEQEEGFAPFVPAWNQTTSIVNVATGERLRYYPDLGSGAETVRLEVPREAIRRHRRRWDRRQGS